MRLNKDSWNALLTVDMRTQQENLTFPMNEVFHHQPGSKVLLVGSYQWNGYFHDSFENCHIEACIHDNHNLANSVWMKFNSLNHRITWRHKIVGSIYAPLPMSTSSCLVSITMVKTVEVRCPWSIENHDQYIWAIYLHIFAKAIHLHQHLGIAPTWWTSVQ